MLKIIKDIIKEHDRMCKEQAEREREKTNINFGSEHPFIRLGTEQRFSELVDKCQPIICNAAQRAKEVEVMKQKQKYGGKSKNINPTCL